MSWRDILVVYRSELRSALRERTIVVNSILIPMFLYPVLIWLMITGITFVIGQTERFVSRVAVAGDAADRSGLAKRLTGEERIELHDGPVDRDEAVGLVRAGKLDAVLELEPVDPPALSGDVRVGVVYDGSKDRSRQARDRIFEVVRELRAERIRKEGEGLGATAAELRQFDIERKNVATRKQMGAKIMGLMLPLFLVLMVAVGCFHPAIDATAGERERGTWETLMTTAAGRSSIVTAKYLYVATMGTVAGLLNLTAMTLSTKAIFAPLMREAGEVIEFEYPLSAVPVLAAGTVLLALFAAAGMMIFASFARTFREGQSMITPFYLLMIIPVLFLQDDGIEFTVKLAAIPVANVLMVFREAIQGRFDVPLIAMSLAVEALAVGLCLWLASFILRFEDVVVGSYSGSLFRFLRTRLPLTKGRST